MGDIVVKLKPTRKHGRHLRVPVLPDEEIKIKQNAAAAGLSIAEYLRRLALGYEIYGVIDQHQVLELSRINADLGRLGGLLKLWLTNDERLTHLNEKTISVVLTRIHDTQAAMLDVVKKL
ncbi:conjugal transfer transcriptional regulator TraJ [Xenorhabdus bovienii]|uniref:conjugal transfer transcriptional regulator TraJ n=1 Tax=Xenorhabdus bovienii TaxID=40576 RepID=UPI003DA3F45E